MNEDVDEYLNGLPPVQRTELIRIRDFVRAAVPSSNESISYMMPAFKYKNKPLLYYAAFKDHLSVFPTSGPIAFLEPELGEFITGKGTIQFTADRPLPDALLKRILEVRVFEIESRRS